jgi:tetratricopeptide (TPR) repeat protein
VNPESTSVNSSIAELYRCQGRLKEAIDHYKKALSVRIDLAATFAALCNAKQYSCDWEEQAECSDHLFKLVKKQIEEGELPCVDPFSLFMYNNFTPE